MFTSTIRPLARQVVSRAYSTKPGFSGPSTSALTVFKTRHAVFATTVVLLATGGWVMNEQRRVLLETPSVRESVLDQPSLKVPLHKPSEENGTKTPQMIRDKKEEAEIESQENSGSQGAFNEETGEINWDCPCLGGMADGPCGEEFKLAFSCFVFSEAEPKGMDCVEKFKGMQDCFRQHPDIYGEEIDDDEDSQNLPEGAKSGKSLPAGHPDLEDVPKPPNAAPPANSKVLLTSSETTMSKGVSKLQPKEGRADKLKDRPSPSSGDGTA